jgi:hypothetical protein
MFSVAQKRAIADAVQNILRDTQHPELPCGEISFHLHVDGAESWSWADIRNNGAVLAPGVNPHNERQAARAAPAEPRYVLCDRCPHPVGCIGQCERTAPAQPAEPVITLTVERGKPMHYEFHRLAWGYGKYDLYLSPSEPD